MQLLTQENLQQLPPLYSQEYTPDPIVWVKFFTPDSSWTWYATEYDPRGRFFGWVTDGRDEGEFGYFLLEELQEATGPYGLPIERDIRFQPVPLSVARKRKL